MVQLTSIEVYEKIKSDGTLKKLRLEVFCFIANNPDCTQAFAAGWLRPNGRLGEGSTISPRFSELVDFGLVEISGDRVEGGNRRYTYKITGATKIKVESPEEKKLKLDRLYRKKGNIELEIFRIESELLKLKNPNQVNIFEGV